MLGSGECRYRKTVPQLERPQQCLGSNLTSGLSPKEEPVLAGLELTPTTPFGRVAAAPELAATRRPLRQAKRQPLIEDRDVRPRDLHPCARPASVLARDRRLSKRLRLPSGLSWAARTASTGTIAFDGEGSRGAGTATIPFLPAPACSALSQWRPNVTSGRRVASRRRASRCSRPSATSIPHSRTSRIRQRRQRRAHDGRAAAAWLGA